MTQHDESQAAPMTTPAVQMTTPAEPTTTLAEPTTTSADAAATPNPRTSGYGVLGAVIAGLFALFYAYNVWEALNSLLSFNGLFEALGLAMPTSMWIVLLAMLILSPLIFVLALWLGWRQRNWARALIFLTGLAVCQVLTLAMTALLVDIGAL